MAQYQDSYCVLWHGPRRGGKSISMAEEEVVALINGRRVFADSPVAFTYPNNDGSWSHYASEPLNYDEFIFIMESDELKKKYMGSVVAWDEVDKWLFSRNWQSVFSKITGQFITLIGKLEMTFLMTAQFIHLVDKNIRVQVDAEIACTDLSFMYPHLGRGTNIGWLAKDMSGRYTGQMYQDTGREYQTTFYAKPFWDVYDTKHAPSILDTMQKVKIEQTTRVLKVGNVDDAFDAPEFKERKDKNRIILDHLTEEIYKSGSTYTRQDLIVMAHQRGYGESDYRLMKQLERNGILLVDRNRYTVLEPVGK